ncbi:MAG: glucoamylase family protein, partial [Pseudomonadota bacterium]
MFSRFAAGREELVSGPLRGELLGPEQLAERARELARGQQWGPATTWREAPLLTRLGQSHKILHEAHARLAAGAARGVDVGPAGEWLLDNFHVVREHIREIHESLPRGYYRELPELTRGALAGYPRVYELTITLISHTEARVDRQSLDGFVAAYQSVTHLSIGELWAVAAMLRLALIESVRRMTLRTVQRMDHIEKADTWAARIATAAEQGEAALGSALDAFVRSHPQLTAAFVSRLLHQLRLIVGSYPILAHIEQWISDHSLGSEDAIARATQHLALTQVIMAHSITSLRTIAHLDWPSFVDGQSAMEPVLREDPAGFYAGMTFGTRDRYRHVVERIARRTGLGEEAVARAAVELARSAEADGREPSLQGHVGYYLADQGLPRLEAATGYRKPLGEAVHRWLLRHPNLVFGGGIAAGTAAALAGPFWLAGPAAQTAWPLVLLLALIPAADLATSAVNQMITAWLPPRTLPKLDLHGKEGVPAQFRTAVVVPTLFDSVEAVQEALANLEVQFLANRGAHIHFAILSDFVDAPTETIAGDAAIVAAGVQGVQALNARYASGTEDAFYLFHRPRRWNPQQGVFMGWERKRGKLAQFNRFLRGGDVDAFSVIVGAVAPLRQVRFVITLDADTVLPPDAAPDLIGALAHPLNRAVYDETSGRVVRGYGILQPRVGISLPSAHRSRFASIHSGHPGVDPYTTAVSDVYQDLYGEGSFTGKGIYDVDAFERATHGRFPENTLLSHDLIEGSYARAALVTEVVVYDDYPSRYLVHARRKHRWIRGDWQLLAWLTARVPGLRGPEPNRLPFLSRWKILDNLRRSTVEIGQLAFLVAGWTVLPGSPLRWTALGLAAIAGPWIVGLALGALRPPWDRSLRAYYAGMARDAATAAQQVALTVTFLAHQAWLSGDAIVRTLWRLFVSKRHLLEWQTASSSERTVSSGAAGVWREMWPAVALAAGAALGLVALAAVGAGRLPLWQLGLAAAPLLLLWGVSPAIAHALSAPPVRPQRQLPAADRAHAERLALIHWHFYERFTGEDTQWLVPDNFQQDPTPVVAMRTSPTNIGLQLLAIVSARDLGFIAAADMTRRLELAFGSMDRLARFKGHFFNWYELHELRVLEPAYVSTVDSGNLAGHLLAVRQACLAAAQEPAVGAEGLSARLQALADRAHGFATAMEFGFLFDRERELFSIGYQHATHTLDPSYYDLFASEARLASFVAIAKDDVPVDHWFRLGRTLTHAGGHPALISWSGSMFEYLMPALVMRAFPFTLLDQTYQGAVRRQIAYGAELGVPWGVSESAYNLRDRHLTYQYRAFGVPDLALKRGLGRDVVIAPYASVLALMVDPSRALSNLATLEHRGALGPYGFRDALDYTRPDPGKSYALIENYMAHHIGMSLVAFTNLLTDQVWPERFHADPLVRSVELLLHERIPRRLVYDKPQASDPDEGLPAPELENPVVREFDDPDTPYPHVAMLGRLPYKLMISHCGSGYSRYNDVAVTRWRADATVDSTGQFCYVKDVGQARVWSATHQPTCAPADAYRALLATDRVTFERVDGAIETRTEIAVVPEDAAEVRRVTVHNHGQDAREIELTSYGEVVLGDIEADRAHPAFAKLFVQTEWHEWCKALTATRRPRTGTEEPLWCVHVVSSGPEQEGPVSYETDRARFVGRGRTNRHPAALSSDGPLSGTTGAVLDPIFALRTRVRLAPGQSACVTFTTLVATSRARAFELADRYHHPSAAQRALDLAWTSQQLELRELGLTPADVAQFQELAGYLFYPRPELRAPAQQLLDNRGSQPLLWEIGVSGDWPVVLASIDSPDGLPTLRQLFAAHHYW